MRVTTSLDGRAGDDTLIGGEGTDTAKFQGNLSDYEITENADGTITVTDTVAGRDDRDVLSSVETLQFADGSHPVSDFATPEPVNAAPNAVDDTGFTTSSDDVLAIPFIDLLSNDTDAESDALTIVSVANAVGGTVEIVQGLERSSRLVLFIILKV